MDSREIAERRLTLDDLAHFDDEMGIEFWYAREIQKFLGYTEWRNFEVAISRAKISADTTKRPDGDHFVEVNKMVSLGSGSHPRHHHDRQGGLLRPAVRLGVLTAIGFNR